MRFAYIAKEEEEEVEWKKGEEDEIDEDETGEEEVKIKTQKFRPSEIFMCFHVLL